AIAAALICSSALSVDPLESSSKATLKGSSTEPNSSICCFTPSSNIVNSFSLKSLTYLPPRSLTTTGTCTSVVFSVIGSSSCDAGFLGRSCCAPACIVKNDRTTTATTNQAKECLLPCFIAATSFILVRGRISSATHRQISESGRPHSFWFVKVPEIYDIGLPHRLMKAVNIQASKLVPFGNHDKSIAAKRGFILIFAINNIRQQASR